MVGLAFGFGFGRGDTNLSSAEPLSNTTSCTAPECASSSCTTSPRCTSHTTTRPVSEPSASRPGAAVLLLPLPVGRGACHATHVQREARCRGRTSGNRRVDVTVSHRLTRPSLETVTSSSGRPLGCGENTVSMRPSSPASQQGARGKTSGHSEIPAAPPSPAALTAFPGGPARRATSARRARRRSRCPRCISSRPSSTWPPAQGQG